MMENDQTKNRIAELELQIIRQKTQYDRARCRFSVQAKENEKLVDHVATLREGFESYRADATEKLHWQHDRIAELEVLILKYKRVVPKNGSKRETRLVIDEPEMENTIPTLREQIGI